MLLIHSSNTLVTEKDNIVTNFELKDQGFIPSLRKIKHSEEAIEYLKLGNQFVPSSSLDTNVLDIESEFINDHDIYYLMKAVKEINGIATVKVLPYNHYDYKLLNSNKLKVMSLPLKDIEYEQIPLTYKIKQLVKNFKREKILNLEELKKTEEKYTDLKIDILFDNDELTDSFKIKNNFKIESYKFPHNVTYFTQSGFTFSNIKGNIKKSLKNLDITNSSGKGVILLLTQEYLFIAPLCNPFIYDINNIPCFAEPMFYAGIFHLPLIESKWSDTIEDKYVQYDLMKVLEVSSTSSTEIKQDSILNNIKK